MHVLSFQVRNVGTCLAEASRRSITAVRIDTAGIFICVAAKQCSQRFARFGASVM